MIKILKIDSYNSDQRLDKFLKRKFSNLTQSFIERNLRKKNILINDQTTKANYLVKTGDKIIIKNYSKVVYLKHSKQNNKIKIDESIKKNFKKSIIFENENFLIIDKWSGIATQGGTNIILSIDNIIKSISQNYNLVHRLDKETSGILIIAKNLKYTKFFGNLFKSQKLKKTYLAICEGSPKLKESFVDLMINSKHKDKKIITKTFYKIISNNKKTSLIKFEPKTGKKHQLRIVAKKLGCPIIGDLKYNLNKSKNKENLKLNAYKLQFSIGEDIFNVTSSLPRDFTNYLKLKNLKFDSKTI